MVVPKKRTSRKLITRKGNAKVYRIFNVSKHQNILKKTQTYSILKSEQPKILFYATSLASLISPGSFVDYSIMRVPKKWKPKKIDGIEIYPKGIQLYSKQVNSSNLHKKYMEIMNKHPKERTIQEKKIIEKYHKERDIREYKEETANKTQKMILEKIKYFEKMGFVFDKNPDNFDMIKGKPFFFEVSTDNPEKLERFIKQKKCNKTFTKQKKARALRLVRRLKQVWNSI